MKRNRAAFNGGVVSSVKLREKKKKEKKNALTGNRTRASRVAGENSTTEPSVLSLLPVSFQMHSFDGTLEEAREAVNFGLYIGLNGW